MGEARLREPCRPGESREPNLTRPGTKSHAVAEKRSLSCISWPPRSVYRPAAGCIKPSISTAGESAPSGSAPRVAAKWLASASAELRTGTPCKPLGELPRRQIWQR